MQVPLVKNRTRTDIVVEVLSMLQSVVPHTLGKTRLMYSCNLNHKQMNWYLEVILNAGLVREIDGEYTIAEKGNEYLKISSKLKRLLPF